MCRVKHFGLLELGGPWEEQSVRVKLSRGRLPGVLNISAEVSRKAQSEPPVCGGFDH